MIVEGISPFPSGLPEVHTVFDTAPLYGETMRKSRSQTFWVSLHKTLICVPASLSVIQTILRHKSPSTTERYLKSFGLENAREALENLSHNGKQSFSSEPDYGKVMFGGK